MIPGPKVTCFLNKDSIKGTNSSEMCLTFACIYVLYLCLNCCCRFDLRMISHLRKALKSVLANTTVMR